MMRSLKIWILILGFVIFNVVVAYAYDTQLVLGATPIATDQTIQQNFWFPGSFRLFTPNGRKPLAFWSNTSGIGAIVPQGLPFEIGLTPVGIENLLTTEISFMNSDSSKFLNQWLPMRAAGGNTYIYDEGNTKDFPWGAVTILFRVTHRDNRAVTRVIFFKFVTIQKGTVQHAFILNIQEAPQDIEKMSPEETFLYLRGFIPASATPADPAIAQKLQEQRERKTAIPPAPLVPLPVAVEQFGSVKIQLLDPSGQPEEGSISIRLTLPSEKVLIGSHKVSASEPLMVNEIPLGSTLKVQPAGASGWFGYRRFETPGEAKPIYLKRRNRQ